VGSKSTEHAGNPIGKETGRGGGGKSRSDIFSEERGPRKRRGKRIEDERLIDTTRTKKKAQGS